ncbi:MAG: M23 family metallopeptidase [bacterium]
MFSKLLVRLRRAWGRPVTVIVMSHSTLPSWRMSLSMPVLIAAAAVWTSVTVWSGYVAGRHFDYWVTKADNKILQTRMKNVAEQVSQGLSYLEMTRKTDEQMRTMLGMGNRSAIIRMEALGGASTADTVDFKKALTGKASRWSESFFRNSIMKVKDESRKRLASFQEITWYIANQRNLYRATPSIWPTNGTITSSYGYRFSPMGRRTGEEFHRGIDIANNPDTPVYATADGVVRHAGWASGYGMAILVDHGFGYSTLYAHATELLVKEGDRVKRGKMIARMGTTGRSTGCHLHYEVWRDGVFTNPMKFLSVGKRNSDISEALGSLLSGKNRF